MQSLNQAIYRYAFQHSNSGVSAKIIYEEMNSRGYVADRSRVDSRLASLVSSDLLNLKRGKYFYSRRHLGRAA